MKKIIILFIFSFFLVGPALATESAPYQPENHWVPDKYKRVHSARLRWSEPTTEDAKYYQLIVRTGDKKAEKVGRWRQVTSLRKDLGGLKANKLYKFRVRACKSEDLCSGWTDWTYFRTKPPQVDRVWIDHASYICAFVKLDRVVRDESANTGYQINLYDKEGNYLKYVQTGYLGHYRQDGYPICDLEPETKYYIKAKAFNSNGDQGKLSPRNSFTTEARDY